MISSTLWDIAFIVVGTQSDGLTMFQLAAPKNVTTKIFFQANRKRSGADCLDLPFKDSLITYEIQAWHSKQNL